MFKCDAKFLSAVFAGFLAATSLTTIAHGAAGAADDCLSGPKDHTPGRGHWYYRIDHATKRHCWYLREEDEKLSQDVAPSSSPSAKPVAPKPLATMQPALADARAELSPRTVFEAPNPVQPPIPAMPAEAAQTQSSLVASRWPDPYSTPAPTEAAPAKREAVESASSAQAQPVLSPEPLAAADASPASPAYSVRLQLAALAAALALAGIVGAVVFRFAGARRPTKTKVRRGRGAIWPPTDDDRIQLSADPEADALPRRRGFARDLDRGDRDERIAEFFAQLSKRTPS